MMMHIYTLILGLYILYESHEAMRPQAKAWCFYVRYISALVSSVYLLSSVFLTLLHHYNLAIPKLFSTIDYSSEGWILRAIMGTAIAASLWHYSKMRWLRWLEIHHSNWHYYIVQHVVTDLREKI